MRVKPQSLQRRPDLRPAAAFFVPCATIENLTGHDGFRKVFFGSTLASASLARLLPAINAMPTNPESAASDGDCPSTEPSPELMPRWSRFAGQPMDRSCKRSIQLQDAPAGKIDNAASHVTLNDFYCDGQFWRAEIPLDAVDQVFGQVFNFSQPRTRSGKDGPELKLNARGLPKRKLPMLNHLQSRFTFHADRPVQLAPIHSDAGETREVTDIVYSIEATGPPGITFNFRDAVGGNLVCAHRMLSTQEMAFERIAVENMLITQSPALALEPAEKRVLLVKSLQRSHQAGMNERYYMLRCCGTNNCTSNPFVILDDVVQYTWPQWLGSQLYRLPLHPRFYLWVRGLDPDSKQFTLVRDEFEDYLSQPATRQRKRDHVRKQIALRRAAQAG